MENYAKSMKAKVSIIVQILLYIAVILALFRKSEHISTISNIAIWLLVSVITTGIVQIIIQKYTGDFLKNIPLTIVIKKKPYSISLFFIVTIILKLFLF